MPERRDDEIKTYRDETDSTCRSRKTAEWNQRKWKRLESKLRLLNTLATLPGWYATSPGCSCAPLGITPNHMSPCSRLVGSGHHLLSQRQEHSERRQQQDLSLSWSPRPSLLRNDAYFQNTKSRGQATNRGTVMNSFQS